MNMTDIPSLQSKETVLGAELNRNTISEYSVGLESKPGKLLLPSNDRKFIIEQARAAINNFFAILRSEPLDQEFEYQQFRDHFLPSFSLVCDLDQPAVALKIESMLYQNFVKRWETEAHFSSVYNNIAPHLRRVGLAVKRSLPLSDDVENSHRDNGDDRGPLVFFILHIESTLAHVQSLIRYLEAFRQFAPLLEPIRPVVVTLDGFDLNLRTKLDELHIPLISLAEEGLKNQNGYSKLVKLAVLCKQHSPQGLVFVSLVLWMSSFFAVRLARTQIWWAMKYHSFSSPDVDGYLCGSPDGKPRLIGGNQWETAPFGGKGWFASDLANEARLIRLKFGNWKTVFGSFGREEKLRDPAFLDTVCGVLEANPETLFIWASRTQDVVIQRFFESRGLLNRTRFMGWINTKLYAQVIDVYLDSFPFPGGYTVFEAMSANKPIVMMELEYTGVGLQNNASRYYFSDDMSGISGEIKTLFRKDEDKIFYPVANNQAEYISFASRFSEDPALRATVGHINAQFVDRYLCNVEGMASGYTDAIKKFINAKSAR